MNRESCLLNSASVQMFRRKFICKLGLAVLGVEDERCCVRRDFENANSASERHLFFLSQRSRATY